ncbi:MAG: HlyD family efflux transporter periplasmic adaptor subunit, partial [Deltaproteobacteria bacterium]|nr:HlyD family efflux transporter periplasmic adaptor subunit [Deltaproteobacteria bacterium]
SASAAQAAGALTTYIQPIRAAIEVEGRKLERLKREKDSSLLRAPEPSRVAVVALRPGSLATPGTPVLTLVAETTSRVIAYIGEAKALSVRPGQQAMLVPRDRSGPAYRGRVVSLGPAITEAPSRFRPVFAQPFWSREAVVQIEQGSQAAGAGSVDAPRVLPGQAFEITFLDEVSEAPLPALALGPATGAGTGTGLTSAPRRAEETEPAAEAGSEQAEAPRLLVVPPALHRRSRLEPSGLVWVPELDRYLLVSDDTGWPRADDHAPWVFTVSAAGEVDEEPLVLQGVPQLNDLEDVTSTASGIYLLSSQSLSRHGRRPPSRELLVRASVGPGRRLVATGQVRLLPALLAAAGRAKGRSWRQGLGLDLPVAESSKTGSVATDLPQLDIEGLAAQPDGTLLLGLKEPLSAGGQALLWRLARPEHLLEKGVLEPEDLTLLARLHLQLQLPGAGGDAVLAMGISGLCTLPGGDLVLLSTIPGDGRQPSGAVWRLPASELERARTSGGGPTLHPLLVRSFPGLKPEGAALSPDGWLALTFDRGQDPPLWLRLRP